MITVGTPALAAALRALPDTPRVVASGNHDAKNWTGGGSRTVDEMAFAWLSWHDLTEEEYAAELESRKANTDNDE